MNKNKGLYVLNPAAGDIAVVQVQTDRFQVVKILSADAGALKFQTGNFLYKSVLAANNAVRDKTTGEIDYFGAEVFGMSSSEYAQLKVRFVQREPYSFSKFTFKRPIQLFQSGMK